MSEYIRRSLAEEAIEEYICRQCKEYNELAGGCISHAMHCPYLSGEEILKPVENEDVQPVKHGQWIPQSNDMWLCSNCKENIIYSMHKSDRKKSSGIVPDAAQEWILYIKMIRLQLQK